MKNLHITVSNKVAEYAKRDGTIVCGNSDYNIVFAFDSEWDAHPVRTARFIWNNKYVDVVFTGNTVAVPVVSDTTTLEVGVYAGTLATTTPAEIACARSILCGGGVPTTPAPDVYTQILALLESGVTVGQRGDSAFIRYSANADGTDFTATWSEGQNYIGFATAQTAPTDKSAYMWCKFVSAGGGESSGVTFSIDGIEYTADKGSTWQDLINNSFTHKGELFDVDPSGNVSDTGYNYNLYDMNDNIVAASAIINNGDWYTSWV